MARTLRLFGPKKRSLGPLLVLALVATIGTPIVVSVGWIAGETMLDLTSGPEYCARCHSMEPMAMAYEDDVHGGRSSSGVAAACVDCHFPHDTTAGFLRARTALAIRELWTVLVGDPSAIDWQARRLDRERYVFDSGCLACHGQLSRPYPRASAVSEAHGAYFAGEIDAHCVTCHASVGHRDLDTHLQ